MLAIHWKLTNAHEKKTSKYKNENGAIAVYY